VCLLFVCSVCSLRDVTATHPFAPFEQYGDLSTLRPSDNRIFPDSNGSIIAVSYEARAAGVKRGCCCCTFDS
jgi:hypothetical protein